MSLRTTGFASGPSSSPFDVATWIELNNESVRSAIRKTLVIRPNRIYGLRRRQQSVAIHLDRRIWSYYQWLVAHFAPGKQAKDVHSPGFESLRSRDAMNALIRRLARIPLWAKIAAPVVVALLVVSGVAGASKNQGSPPVALPSTQSSASVPADVSTTIASVAAATTLPPTIAATVPPTAAPTIPPTTPTVPPTPSPTVPPTVPPTAAPTTPATVAETLPTAPPLAAPSGTDPRFDTCKLAKANGFGPYVQGQDVEYSWYRDADSDGTVCE